MVKKTYSVIFEEELIEEAKKYYNEYGGKLNPLIVHLLESWIKQQKIKEGKK